MNNKPESTSSGVEPLHHAGLQSLKKLTQKSNIYSGFASKQQELFYDKLAEKALKMMSERIIQCLEYENQAGGRRHEKNDNRPTSPPRLVSGAKPIEVSEDVQFFKHVRKL